MSSQAGRPAQMGSIEFGRSGQLEVDHPIASVRVLELGQVAVVDDPAVVDDHDALADVLDVAEVVSRQHHRGPSLDDQAPHEAADAVLDRDVEADGRLVEVERSGVVEEGHAQVGAHPLTERYLAGRDVHELVQAEQLGEFAEVIPCSGPAGSRTCRGPG